MSGLPQSGGANAEAVSRCVSQPPPMETAVVNASFQIDPSRGFETQTPHVSGKKVETAHLTTAAAPSTVLHV